MDIDRQQIIIEEIGQVSYGDALAYQEKLLSEKQEGDKQSSGAVHHLLFCEHPHVYTLGKSAKENNVLINMEMLRKLGAELHQTNRGGDVTYHGPGQIVAYPIFDLNRLKIGVKQYVHLLEEAVIISLNGYGIETARLDNATGVWLDSGTSRERKICAMGIRVSRGITMHGLALNVNTDLSFFNHINPCGFADKGVTSMKKELGRTVETKEVQSKLARSIKELFKLNE